MVTKPASALEMIQAIEQADSPARLVAAVRALAESRLAEGIPALIRALGFNNPEAAVTAVEGLVQLGEVAVPALLELLDDYNYGARAYSFRALAAIGDPRSLEALINAAEVDFAPSVRRAAAKGLGNLRWPLLPEEQRSPAQAQALKTLLLVSQDPEWAIRYAAVVGLQALASSAAKTSVASTTLVASILARFCEMAQAEPDRVVCARVFMAQQQINATASS